MRDKLSETRILDAARRLTQTRGYHGFSYADVAAVVGIRKASIHYYFPAKADLGARLVRCYRAEMSAERERIDALAHASAEGAGAAAEQKLRRFAQLFRALLRDPRVEGGVGGVCLAGALAAELPSLPPAVQAEVTAFFAETEAWLAAVLAAGRSAGRVRFRGPAAVQARGLLATLEGAQLLARAHGDVESYCAAAHQMLDHLGLDISEMDILAPDRAAALALALRP